MGADGREDLCVDAVDNDVFHWDIFLTSFKSDSTLGKVSFATNCCA